MKVLGVLRRPEIGGEALPLRRIAIHAEVPRPNCKQSSVLGEQEDELGVSGATQPQGCENV